MGLYDAKNMVDGAPQIIYYGLSQKDAEAFKAALEEAGATVEIQ